MDVFLGRVDRGLLETVYVEVIEPDNSHRPSADTRDCDPVDIAVDSGVREFHDERRARSSPLAAMPLKAEGEESRATLAIEITDEV
jgi:hypothetical protein